MRRRRLRLLALLAPLLVSATADPGIVLEVDLGGYRLQARDLASGSPGPSLRVAVGSPAHPTPTGEFRPVRVVRNPGWTPGPVARSRGARARPPSSDGPLGVGKIPLEFGAIQIHAGADPVELEKPVSLGCVSTLDERWLRLVAWLEQRDALEPWRTEPAGDVVTGFRRPIRVVVHRGGPSPSVPPSGPWSTDPRR